MTNGPENVHLTHDIYSNTFINILEYSPRAGTRTSIGFKSLKPTETPRATRYAELGGSWNSEVNKGNHARQGSVLLDF